MLRKAKVLLPGDRARMIMIAAFIGVMSGVAIIVFRESVEFVDEIALGWGYELLGIDKGGWRRLLLPILPMLGASLLIPLSLSFPGEVNGYGFTNFLRKVNLENGVIRARSLFIKIVATALTIGSGNSAGVEGPIAQIGGAVGSQVGQRFRVSGKRMKVYIAAGCAGGIAGIFNAPLAGMFFAAEIVLLGTYEISSFSALVISSALSTVISRAYYGEIPAFPIPAYSIVNPFVELPLYTLMAVIVGVTAVMHIHFFYGIRDLFRKVPVHPQIKPIFGALLVGSIAIFFPQIMGNGYEYIEVSLTGDAIVWQMMVLVFLKSLATSITLGSGGAGGVFAPALFIGAVLGGAYGGIVHYLFPAYTASAGAYATVGIGAFLAATTHAPLTAIFLLFEMTGNYMIIIPVMLTAIVGTVTSSWLYHDSMDTVDFTREGIDIHEGREVAIMKSIRVGKAITEDVDFISETANINHLLQLFRFARNSFYFPVINAKGLMVGVVSMQDVKTILHSEEERVCHLVGAICTRDVIMLTPDTNCYEAMKLFDVKGIDEIPVVESQEEPWVLGMLKRQDVVAAYNHEMLKRGINERADSIRMLCSAG
ncbi:chloride channel protein [Desulfobulbus rhabdoformis]|uniref:chloride channel protein n=1 Tax=Desulfobulbus rhabdoformis TaxID=34032 RepID=UPI0019638D13|nr:chloride channel protein [Desulfobulbus rhabdoformis]MBM9615847.1 chloride channel protein [Desulfobulbus rhabdoformis]